jgi:hypothetical protein
LLASESPNNAENIGEALPRMFEIYELAEWANNWFDETTASIARIHAATEEL